LHTHDVLLTVSSRNELLQLFRWQSVTKKYARRFRAIKDHLVEFNQLAIEAADGSHDMINRVMTKDNIGLALLLETTEGVWANGESMLRLVFSETCSRLIA